MCACVCACVFGVRLLLPYDGVRCVSPLSPVVVGLCPLACRNATGQDAATGERALTGPS